MRNLILGSIVCTLIFAVGGCRSKNRPPEARPLPPGKLQVSLNVDVEVAAPTSPRPASVGKSGHSQHKKADAARKTSPKRSQQVADTVYEDNPAAKERIRVTVSDSNLESELNDVERSYIRQIKQRHQQQVKANEDRVFGSFNPSKLMQPARK